MVQKLVIEYEDDDMLPSLLGIEAVQQNVSRQELVKFYIREGFWTFPKLLVGPEKAPKPEPGA